MVMREGKNAGCHLVCCRDVAHQICGSRQLAGAVRGEDRVDVGVDAPFSAQQRDQGYSQIHLQAV